MLKGYQEESEKSLLKAKTQDREIKTLTDKLAGEQKKVKELQQKALLERDKVFVEEGEAELDIDTVNNMGIGNAISQQQLKDLHAQLQRLQHEKLDFERESGVLQGTFKS